MSILNTGWKIIFFLCSLFLLSSAKLIAQEVDILQGLGTEDLRLSEVPDTLFQVDPTFLDSSTLLAYIEARAEYPSYNTKQIQVTESLYLSAKTIVWITREFSGPLHQRVIRSFYRLSNDDPFVENSPVYASRGFIEQVGVYPYRLIKNKFLQENDCPPKCVRGLSTARVDLASVGPDSIKITRFAVIEVPEKGKGYGELERRTTVKSIDDITDPFIRVGWYANSVQYYCNCEEKD